MQIIAEMETDGHESLLTNRILEELIRFYGDKMMAMLAPLHDDPRWGYRALISLNQGEGWVNPQDADSTILRAQISSRIRKLA
jgi:hypothetical protein